MKVIGLLAFFLAYFLLSEAQQPMTGVISATYPNGTAFAPTVPFFAYDQQRGLLFGAGDYGLIYTFNSTSLVLMSTNDLKTMSVGVVTFTIVSTPLGIYLRPGSSPRLIVAYTFNGYDSTVNAGHTVLLDCSNVYNMSALAALNVTSSYTPTIYDSNFFHADSFTYFALYTDSNIRSTYIFGYRLTNDSFWMTRSKLTVILPNANHAGIYSYSGGKTSVYNTKPWYNGSKFITFDHELSTSTTFVATKLAFGTEVVTQGTDGKTITFKNTREFANPPGFESLRYFEEGSRDVPTIKMFTVGSTTNSGYILYDLNSIPYAGNLVVQVSASDLAIESRDTLIPKSFNIFPNQQAFNTIEVDENVDATNTTRVMFFGTKSGRVMKYKYSDNGGQLSIDTNPISTENIIAPGLPITNQFVIHSEKRMFVSSGNGAPSDQPKLFIVPFADCGSRTSCDSCIAMNDPYCGWCVLDGKCSYQSSCSSAASANGWLKSTCPAVSNYESDDPIHVGHSGSASFALSNIPNVSYSCSFKRENGDTIQQTATGSLSNLTCSIPSISTPLAKNTHEVLTLSVVPSGKNAIVAHVSSTVVVFNCSASLSCSECANHPYDCVWSTEENFCVDASTTISTQVSSSEGSCPFLSSGPVATIPENSTTFLTIQGSNLPLSGTNQYTCVFSNGDITSATRTSSSILSCESPLVFTDISPLKDIHVEVKYGSYTLPRAHNIVVTYYSCIFFGGC